MNYCSYLFLWLQAFIKAFVSLIRGLTLKLSLEFLCLFGLFFFSVIAIFLNATLIFTVKMIAMERADS